MARRDQLKLLKGEKAKWDKWRWRAGSDIPLDFTGANISGINLSSYDLGGANLSRASLRRANLSDADLTDANLQDADLLEAAPIGSASACKRTRNARSSGKFSKLPDVKERTPCPHSNHTL